MIHAYIERIVHLQWLKIIALLFLGGIACSASAQTNLILLSISDGYSGCSWRDNGNGTSTLSLSIKFKTTTGNSAGYKVWSRGILIYTYDKNGKVNPSSLVAESVSMGGVKSPSTFTGSDYSIYGDTSSATGTQWKNLDPFVADVKVVVNNSYITAWPAISIRAGTYTVGAPDIGEIKGAAYISRDGVDGVCQVVDPANPPPASISINVTAPDWNLGELPRGEGEKTLSSSAQQLCFTYTGAAVNGTNFVINASSTNGIVNNRYFLKNLTDASQTVPYGITLDSGTSVLSLPNSNSTALPLSSTGKTCFVPTFKTTIERSVKEGDYSDVLTFTVVTKT